jgi:hypothetical protein
MTTRCTVHLTRPAVAAVEGTPKVGDGWDLDLDLSDDQADGRTCLRCGERGGAMVPVGVAYRPVEVLRRLNVSDEAVSCQVFAHLECRPA